MTEYRHSYTDGKATSPNLWTDAYLLAFAITAQFKLITFDRKLASHGQSSCLLLDPSF